MVAGYDKLHIYKKIQLDEHDIYVFKDENEYYSYSITFSNKVDKVVWSYVSNNNKHIQRVFIRNNNGSFNQKMSGGRYKKVFVLFRFFKMMEVNGNDVV